MSCEAGHRRRSRTLCRRQLCIGPGLARATPGLPPDQAVTAVTGEGKRKWVNDDDDDGIVTHVYAA